MEELLLQQELKGLQHLLQGVHSPPPVPGMRSAELSPGTEGVRNDG